MVDIVSVVNAVVEWLKGLAVALAPYANVIAAFAAVVTAIIAVIALGSTANDSRERSRPLVFAMFRQAEHSDTSFELVVRNYGASAARELSVTFDPPLSAEDRQETRTDFVARRYDRTIPLLPPGSELSNTWWGGRVAAGGNELVNGLNTPDEVTVSVRYKGNRIRYYSDQFALSADTMKLTTYSVSSTSMRGRMKTIAESLTSLATQTKGINGLIYDIGRRLVPDDEEDDPANM
ncbi:hypothetical protein [Leifsonia sp. RAF41]|uniref:hypothetical protein n=1 Tax=Leifsonia sp. RAF41 TaxID=3233056 RepID=UPI003F9B4826